MRYLFGFSLASFSPNHADPPLYNSGQGTVWQYGVLTDGSKIVNDDLPAPEPVHVRSRGTHDPGDGVYTNRWAFPPEGERDAHLPSSTQSISRWVMTSSAAFNWQKDYNPNADYRQCYEYWDGTMHVLSRVWDRYNQHRYYYARCRAYWIDPNITMRRSGSSWYARINVRYYDYDDATLYDNPDDCAGRTAQIHSLLCSCSFSNPYPGSGLITNRDYYAELADDLVVDAAPARLSPEMNIFSDQVTMLPHTHIGTLEAEAYRRAVDALPRAGMNNIANIVETISLINNMLFSGGLSTVGSVSDAWLAYRYSYSTTKSDIEEMAKLIERLENLTRTSKVTTRAVVFDGEYTVRCSIDLHSTELASLHSKAERWGLALNAYNMWDMIPYSFVADWFLNVGGALERGESIKYAYRCRKPAWFSIERRWLNEFGCREIYYHRHFASPNLSEAYLYRTVNDPSGVTIVKRAIDALALVR